MSRPDPASFDRLVDAYDVLAEIKSDEETGYFLENLSWLRGSALDVGCGTGVLAAELAKHYDEVVGIDLSEPMLARARERRSAPNVSYMVMDARAIDLGRQFDLIVSRTTFHHIEDVPAVLEGLTGLVSPGGRIVIVDCVGGSRVLIRTRLVAGALVLLPIDAARRGIRASLSLFRARVARPWLDHLAHDRFLSECRFEEVYGSVLQGARFEKTGYFMAVVWDAPAAGSPAAGSPAAGSPAAGSPAAGDP